MSTDPQGNGTMVSEERALPADAGTMPKVLVVVPTLNEASTIERVLTALEHGLPPTASATLVVADGGSDDGTPDVVRRIAAQRGHVRLLHNPQRIQSAGINRAVREFGCDADVLVRCDAHASYPQDFVARLIASLQRTRADAIVVPMDSRGEGCLQRAIAWVSDTVVGSGGSAHRGGRRSGFVDHGHHAAFRMDMFRRCGGYDETFTHNEDAELDCRQRALSARIFLDADIRVCYSPRSTLRELGRQYFHYGIGRSRTLRRHPGSVRGRQLAVAGLLPSCALALLFAPWWPLLPMWPASYLAALAGVSVWLCLRHRSLCALLAGPAALVMHAAWGLGLGWGWLSVREQRWQPGNRPPLWSDPPSFEGPA